MAVISKTDLENAKLDADDLASFVSDTAGNVTPRTGGTYPNIRQLVANFNAVLAEQEIEEETATAQAVIATNKAAEAAASAASIGDVHTYMSVLAKRFEGYGPGSFVAGQADWVRTMRNNLTKYYFDTRAGNNANDASSPQKSKIDAISTYSAVKTTAASLLFRNGQQHLFQAVANPGPAFPQFGGVSLTLNPLCLGNYGSGALAPPLIDTRYLVTETWTSVTTDIWEATLPVDSTVFGTSGAAPNVNGPRPTLWVKPDKTSENIGTRLPWITGGASASANNTALAALPGEGVTVRAPNGSGFETAGDIRSTGATLTSLVVRVKRPSGVNPNTERLFLVNRGASVVFYGGWHGSFTLVPGMGKDSASFSPADIGYGVLYREIPWGEEVTIYGHGHAGVGCMNTTGKFSGIGVPCEGDVSFPVGRTDGYAVHRFDPGFDLRDQFLYNQSIYAANASNGIGMHGSGTPNEGYRGWIIPDDITIKNCANGISPDLLMEGFYHYGRLDVEAQNIVNAYTTPYIRVASKGGLAKAIPAQQAFVQFSSAPPNGYIVDVGSDNLEEVLWLDASAILPSSPTFHAATLAICNSLAAPVAMNKLILRNVRDKNTGLYSYRLVTSTGFYINANRFWLDLRAGTKLNNAFTTDVDLIASPSRMPDRLSWAAGVQWGLGNKTFTQIEAAYAAAGRTCTIAPGAIAINVAGTVIDVKV